MLVDVAGYAINPSFVAGVRRPYLSLIGHYIMYIYLSNGTELEIETHDGEKLQEEYEDLLYFCNNYSERNKGYAKRIPNHNTGIDFVNEVEDVEFQKFKEIKSRIR